MFNGTLNYHSISHNKDTVKQRGTIQNRNVCQQKVKESQVITGNSGFRETQGNLKLFFLVGKRILISTDTYGLRAV